MYFLYNSDQCEPPPVCVYVCLLPLAIARSFHKYARLLIDFRLRDYADPPAARARARRKYAVYFDRNERHGIYENTDYRTSR